MIGPRQSRSRPLVNIMICVRREKSNTNLIKTFKTRLLLFWGRCMFVFYCAHEGCLSNFVIRLLSYAIDMYHSKEHIDPDQVIFFLFFSFFWRLNCKRQRSIAKRKYRVLISNGKINRFCYLFPNLEAELLVFNNCLDC